MINKIKKYFHDRQKTTLPPVNVEGSVSAYSQTFDWGLKQLNIPNVWTKTKGAGVTIGVIDTGMPYHNDIGDNAIAGESFIPGEDIEDLQGHQTHCVGIISAMDNGFGMVGVAPQATCLCVKGLSNSGSGTYGGLISSLQYCLDKKVDLVSMSLGGPNPSAEMEQMIDKLIQANIPVICAAGNSGNAGVGYPGGYTNTIAVGAYDEYGRVAGFSSKGPEVDFAKPGVAIYSTYLNNSYSRMSGTSMATPFMAGVVALLLSKWKSDKRQYTVDDVIDKLKAHAVDKGSQGKDENWGHGVVDVESIFFKKKSPQLPAPSPTPEPTPSPEPVPSPTPQPVIKPPQKIKKNYIAWIVLGIFVLVVGGIGVYQYWSNRVDIPPPPYIDDHGNINWDEKYETER